MFTPEYLNDLVESTSAAATDFNMYLTNKVIDSVINLFEKDGKLEIIPSNQHRIKLLKQSGILVSDIEKEIKKRLPGLDKKVREAFYRAGYDINEDINKSVSDMVESDQELKSFVGKAPRLENLTDNEKKILDAAYKRTNGEIKNLTKTTAADINQQFLKSCDSAWWKANHGVDTATAIREAIDEVSAYGSHVIYRRKDKKSGLIKERKLSVESAVRMCVLTGINQANAEVTLSLCAEMGVKNVLVSSHLGARYTDKIEPANHESWQGKPYTLSDKLLKEFGYVEQENRSIFAKIKEFFQKFRREQTYEDFETVTGYGSIEGACGINCRHTFVLLYPGMKNNQKQYSTEENKKAYDLSQKKRAMERQIRDTKKRIFEMRHAIKAASDEKLIAELKSKETEIKRLFDKQNSAYSAFCGQNGLRRSEDRLYVSNSFSLGVIDKPINSGIINLSVDEQYAINKYISDGAYVLNDKLRRGEALSADEQVWIKNLDAALDKVPEYQGIVYRSVSDYGIEDVESYISDHVVDGGFSSLAYISSSENVYDESFPIQYIIKSKHGRDIRAYNQTEQEILFKRNSRFYVTKVDGHTIYLEED